MTSPYPSVVLHDHLDGGLRPATILDLAVSVGHTPPADDPAALAAWFVSAASAGSLPRFLETFAHTVAVMQTEEALTRVAREAVIDHARDGVIYAEIRYAPELHLERGLTMPRVIEAVQAGVDEGIVEAAREGWTIRAATLLTAMRHAHRSTEVARHAIDYRSRCCVGFDIAGAEDGFPPSMHAEAFALLRDAHIPTSIHAGEAAGVASISEAVGIGAARRLAHGVRVIEDVTWPDGPDGAAVFGSVAAFVRDFRIPLEVCPTSNTQTGVATSIAAHPITALRDLGFAVTINPDNRLMCGTTQSREMNLLVSDAGWDRADLEGATLEAAWAAFQPLDVREELAEAVIDGFAVAAS